MRRRRSTDVLIFIALFLLIGLSFKAPRDKSETKPAASASAALHEPQDPEAVVTPAVFRYSSRGGCFADSDFYFELRTDETGASWIAVLVAYGSWDENLIEGAPKSRRTDGNFLSCGRLNIRETNLFLERLVDCSPLDIRNASYHTGPSSSIFVKLGDEENKVANFQSNFESKDSPVNRFIDFAVSPGLLSDQYQMLYKQYQEGEIPAHPLKTPGHHWLTKEEENLFSVYADLLPVAPSKGLTQ